MKENYSKIPVVVRSVGIQILIGIHFFLFLISDFDIHFEIQTDLPQNRIRKGVITKYLSLSEPWEFRFRQVIHSFFQWEDLCKHYFTSSSNKTEMPVDNALA